MTIRDYYQWARVFQSSSSLYRLLLSLPSCTIVQRKCLLAYTRIRSPLLGDTLFEKYYAHELCSMISIDESGGHDPGRAYKVSVHMVVSSLHDYCSDPVTMGLISTAIRSAPYEDYSSVAETLQQTIRKEIQAALGSTYNAPLNYDAIFGTAADARTTRLFSNLPLDPVTATSIRRSFLLSKKLLHGKVIYPKVSVKTIGMSAQADAESAFPEEIMEDAGVTKVTSVADVERLYHHTGVHLEGDVEMRSAWKFNDLKPRVYYAQGPTCYEASRYVQPIMNVIVDCFECVHRYNRFQLPIDTKFRQFDRVVTYDYSSFTSNLDEVKRFTRRLADFYSDVEVVIVDSREGPVTKNLGELLLHYTEVCNESSDFDVSRVLGLDIPLILRHTTGMLGVPGNISSCTLLHGIHLCFLLASTNRGRCVGDDALCWVTDGAIEEQWDLLIQGVNNLGEIAEQKFTSWTLDSDQVLCAWQYLKRPITFESGHPIQGDAVVFPALENLIDLKDDYHTFIPKSDFQRRKSAGVQWARLLTRLHSLPHLVQDSSRITLRQFQNFLYDKLEFKSGGIIRFKLGTCSTTLTVPVRMTEEEFGTDWVFATVEAERAHGGTVFLKVPMHAYPAEKFVGREGELFAHPQGSALLGLMEKLGYVEKELQREEVRLADVSSPEFLNHCFTKQYDFMYEYTVVRDFPVWADVVSSLHLMSPHERLAICATEEEAGEDEDYDITALVR